jgi:ATP-dependent Clp protease adaptor protein ClpS
MSVKEKTQIKLEVSKQTIKNNEIVLYNDDVNTFDHVIDTLVAVCDQTSEPAEQCAILVHYQGKCTVKTGLFKDLKPACSQLLSAGLSAEIV